MFMLTFVFAVLVYDGANFCIPLSLIEENNFFLQLFSYHAAFAGWLFPQLAQTTLSILLPSWHFSVGWVPAHLTHLACLLQ